MEMAAPNIVALRGIEVTRSTDVRPAFRINPRLVLSVLLLASSVLGVLDLVTLATKSEIGSEQVRRIFNVDEEVSIPTWFSVLQLIAASMILGFVAMIRAVLHDRFAMHWDCWLWSWSDYRWMRRPEFTKLVRNCSRALGSVASG